MSATVILGKCVNIQPFQFKFNSALFKRLSCSSIVEVKVKTKNKFVFLKCFVNPLYHVKAYNYFLFINRFPQFCHSLC